MTNRQSYNKVGISKFNWLSNATPAKISDAWAWNQNSMNMNIMSSFIMPQCRWYRVISCNWSVITVCVQTGTFLDVPSDAVWC